MKQLGLACMQYAADFDEVTVPCYVGSDQSIVSGATAGTALRWPHLIYPYVKAPGAYTCPSQSARLPFIPVGGTLLAGQNTGSDDGSYAINAAFIDNAIETTPALGGLFTAVTTGEQVGTERAHTPAGQPLAKMPMPAETVYLLESGGYPRLLLYDGRAVSVGPLTTGVIAGNANGIRGKVWMGSQAAYNANTSGQYVCAGYHNDGMTVVMADGHAKWQSMQSLCGHVNSQDVDYEFSADDDAAL
jgi:prepilin-type processing-associated H-X9-DG protein